MIKLLLIGLVFLSGLGLSCQATFNGTLGKSIGIIEASLVSFVVGTLGLALTMLFFGKGNLVGVFSVPKWQLLGGLLGAVYIAILVIAIPRIGVVISLLSVICGQTAMSMVIDSFGLFNVQKIPFNWPRLFGIVLLVAALILIYRGSTAPKQSSVTVHHNSVSSSENT